MAYALKTFIASLSKAVVFFGISAKVVQIMASQIAEFFCGVIYTVIVEPWRPFRDALSWEATRFYQQGNHKRHNTFSKGFAGTTAFPICPSNPAAPLHYHKPASAAYGAKILLRKVLQYTSHSAVCQAEFTFFFNGIKISAA